MMKYVLLIIKIVLRFFLKTIFLHHRKKALSYFTAVYSNLQYTENNDKSYVCSKKLYLLSAQQDLY